MKYRLAIQEQTTRAAGSKRTGRRQRTANMIQAINRQAQRLAVNQQYSRCRQKLRNVKVLPAIKRCANVNSVPAKSGTRTLTPVFSKAQQSPAERLFCCVLLQHTHVMTGLKGLPSGRPVSFEAGGENPFSPVAISVFSHWVTGSKLKGDCPMATYRLALLEGQSPRLCDRRVRGYITLSFNSRNAARKEAHRLNAVVCGWNTGRGAA
ncbi:hypothetical protein [Endozoicomonas montiporae]|uniref:hypothetical protein n=1 Tax=Endozoicomonas montiporae TaxID=1027273 RepID=UPI00165138E8|nr:hypothetical protein [Endozoicomonas montiporae]